MWSASRATNTAAGTIGDTSGLVADRGNGVRRTTLWCFVSSATNPPVARVDPIRVYLWARLRTSHRHTIPASSAIFCDGRTQRDVLRKRLERLVDDDPVAVDEQQRVVAVSIDPAESAKNTSHSSRPVAASRQIVSRRSPS